MEMRRVVYNEKSASSSHDLRWHQCFQACLKKRRGQPSLPIKVTVEYGQQQQQQAPESREAGTSTAQHGGIFGSPTTISQLVELITERKGQAYRPADIVLMCHHLGNLCHHDRTMTSSKWETAQVRQNAMHSALRGTSCATSHTYAVKQL